MKVKRGRLVDSFAITPNISLCWTKFSMGRMYYMQIAWLRWYIHLIINNNIAKAYGL